MSGSNYDDELMAILASEILEHERMIDEPPEGPQELLGGLLFGRKGPTLHYQRRGRQGFQLQSVIDGAT